MSNSRVSRTGGLVISYRKTTAAVVLLSLFAATLILPAGWLSVVRPAEAASTDLVISQVYGGGGNTGATFKNDFIEIFNRGSSAVDVTGWSVQYASSGGNSWQVTNLTGAIQPGHYYLVQEAAGAGGTTSLPTPDAIGSGSGISMSGTSGKVALVTNQTALTCGSATLNCSTIAAIKDFVGFGTAATNFEGSGPTANLSNTTAALRGGNGCVDTDNNSADFVARHSEPAQQRKPGERLRSRDADADPDADAGATVTGTRCHKPGLRRRRQHGIDPQK